MPSMAWEVEYTNEFAAWWETLTESEQIDVAAVIGLLESSGSPIRCTSPNLEGGGILDG
jgi:hypothetical protein